MKEKWKQAYGSYSIPDDIYKLHDLENRLQNNKLSSAMICFRPIIFAYAYAITPPDLIPFADTGGDGIHFGFLTDFGRVKDLTQAPIVCVTPTNDPPIRYIARNLKGFLNMAASVPDVEMLESFMFLDDAQIQKECELVEKDTPRKLLKQRAKITKQLIETFQLETVSVHTCLSEARQEREGKIVISTTDGLGIVDDRENGKQFRSYEWDYANPFSEQEKERMQAFLQEAKLVEKLAFIRDANMRYITAPGYDEVVWQLMIDTLKELGLEDDAARLRIRE
ncbi:hypothetical protein [Radiobacillus sp. PE A8.2]|uniref:hypothetical protein n=1 Tax=Radiobacillus sp. PE A8.2 TaxID=3380349 RepID=UPI003890EC0F